MAQLRNLKAGLRSPRPQWPSANHKNARPVSVPKNRHKAPNHRGRVQVQSLQRGLMRPPSRQQNRRADNHRARASISGDAFFRRVSSGFCGTAEPHCSPASCAASATSVCAMGVVLMPCPPAAAKVQDFIFAECPVVARRSQQFAARSPSPSVRVAGLVEDQFSASGAIRLERLGALDQQLRYAPPAREQSRHQCTRLTA